MSPALEKCEKLALEVSQAGNLLERAKVAVAVNRARLAWEQRNPQDQFWALLHQHHCEALHDYLNSFTLSGMRKPYPGLYKLGSARALQQALLLPPCAEWAARQVLSDEEVRDGALGSCSVEPERARTYLLLRLSLPERERQMHRAGRTWQALEEYGTSSPS